MKLYIQPDGKTLYVPKTKQEKRIKCNLHYFVLVFFISFVILESDTINGSNLPGETRKNIEILEPEPLEPEVGMVLIELNTEPKGANVLIDNNDYGLTPLIDILLTEGYHNIKISLNDVIIINERIEIKEDGKNYYFFNLFDHFIASGKWNELVKFGDYAVDTLINLLADEDWHNRLNAVVALGEIGNSRAKGSLQNVAKTDANPDVKAKANDILKNVWDINLIKEEKVYKDIVQKIKNTKDLCELRKIEKENVNKFINDYQDSEYVSMLKNQLDKKHKELKSENMAQFETLKQKIAQFEKIDAVRELATQFRKENQCSDFLGDINNYVELRIEAINRMNTEYESIVRKITEANKPHVLSSIEEKVKKFIEDYPNNKYISRLENKLQKKRSILNNIKTEPESQTVSDYNNIKNIVHGINNAIRTGKVDEFCQFLAKKNDVFYSRERQIMKDFVKEIQVIDSSVDKINIEINSDTTNVQYLLNMDFKWNAYPDTEFTNICMVSLKLRKNDSNWEVFDARILSR